MGKWSAIENISIYCAVAICTVSVAAFTGTGWGLLSMLMLTMTNRR